MPRHVFHLMILVMVVTARAAGQSPDVSAHRISYGAETTSFGELVVPRGAGPFPIAVLLHGGCWKAGLGRVDEMRPMATMFAGHGIASWNVEYRRVGHAGGGWPGTFRDLSDAADYVRELARSYPLDIQRVVVVGHSSGGYFGAWLAGRSHLPTNSPLSGPLPLKLAGMVLLDAFLDPRVIDSHGVDGQPFCEGPLLPTLIVRMVGARKQ